MIINLFKQLILIYLSVLLKYMFNKQIKVKSKQWNIKKKKKKVKKKKI